MTQQLNVQIATESNQYPIYIGDDLLNTDLIPKLIKGNQVMIISNKVIADHYLNTLKIAIATHHQQNCQIDELLLDEGETNKTLATVELVINELMYNKHNRTTTLIALGGGIIGDITGYVASCFQRGVNFIQVPTSLLAQVDSSIGGKTGVNHPLGKNMIGAFYQPQAVIIDTNTLSTLPKNQLSAGISEMIKVALMADKDFFSWLEKELLTLLSLDKQILQQAINRAVDIKATIVEADEKEQGKRALLNLGHTFGHALETLTEYSYYLHGEAVAIGILMAADLSQRMGWLTQEDVERVKHLLLQVRLPVSIIPTFSLEQFLEAMSFDKKNQNNQLRLILMSELGNAIIVDEGFDEYLRQTIEHFNQAS